MAMTDLSCPPGSTAGAVLLASPAARVPGALGDARAQRAPGGQLSTANDPREA